MSPKEIINMESFLSNCWIITEMSPSAGPFKVPRVVYYSLMPLSTVGEECGNLQQSGQHMSLNLG